MQRRGVIEAYLDGCKFNVVGCGHRSPWAGEREKYEGMEEWNMSSPETSCSKAKQMADSSI